MSMLIPHKNFEISYPFTFFLIGTSHLCSFWTVKIASQYTVPTGSACKVYMSSAYCQWQLQTLNKRLSERRKMAINTLEVKVHFLTLLSCYFSTIHGRIEKRANFDFPGWTRDCPSSSVFWVIFSRPAFFLFDFGLLFNRTSFFLRKITLEWGTLLSKISLPWKYLLSRGLIRSTLWLLWASKKWKMVQKW